MSELELTRNRAGGFRPRHCPSRAGRGVALGAQYLPTFCAARAIFSRRHTGKETANTPYPYGVPALCPQHARTNGQQGRAARSNEQPNRKIIAL